MDDAVIGIRYCGGCNPRYDRVALAGKLAASFPELAFRSGLTDSDCLAVLVFCGCPVRCALRPEELRDPRLIPISSPEDLPLARERLEQQLFSAWEAVSLTHEQVLQVLPHREPMLFVDSVPSLAPGRRAVTLFHARPELPCFAGHFPGEPVLPGIYTVEATAQAADILMMTGDRYAGKIPLFMGIEHARFRRKILPGDTLEIHIALAEDQAARAIAACRGEIYVRGQLAADLEVRLAFR